jgi:hypothetical protein
MSAHLAYLRRPCRARLEDPCGGLSATVPVNAAASLGLSLLTLRLSFVELLPVLRSGTEWRIKQGLLTMSRCLSLATKSMIPIDPSGKPHLHCMATCCGAHVQQL